jgi:zinc protease
LFGDWKGSSTYARVQAPYFVVASSDLSPETPDKQNPMFVARLNLKLRNDNPDYAALTLGNYMFGGGSLIRD